MQPGKGWRGRVTALFLRVSSNDYPNSIMLVFADKNNGREIRIAKGEMTKPLHRTFPAWKVKKWKLIQVLELWRKQKKAED